MPWRGEWLRLSERIGGLIEACRYMTSSLAAQNNDQYGVARKILLPEVNDIVGRIRAFSSEFGPSLPMGATENLRGFLEAFPMNVVSQGANTALLDLQVAAPLGVFRSRMEYALLESNVRIKALTERAFEHLQRTIIADAASREKWMIAFKAGETACEALGAVHLLAHGIWAFKVHGIGNAPGAAEATDLVYQEPLHDLERIEKMSEGLVLTEWKLVKTKGELEAKRTAAIKQAELYEAGILGGLELKALRYVVLISEDIVHPHTDAAVGSISYRTIMLRVSPSSASKAARKKS